MTLEEYFKQNNLNDNFGGNGIYEKGMTFEQYHKAIKLTPYNDLISRYNNRTLADYSKYGDYSSHIGQYDSFIKEANELLTQLDSLKTDFSEDEYNKISEALNSILSDSDTQKKNMQTLVDFYSSFEDENQYKAWDTDRRLYAEHGDLTTENVDYFIRSMEKRKAKGELNGYEQEFYDWIKQYDLTHGYKDKEYVKKRLEQLNQDLLEASKDNGSHYDDHGRKWTLKSAKYSEIEGRIGDINKLHTDYNLENAYKDKGYSLNKGAIGFEEKAAKYENSVTGEVNKPTSPQNVIKTKDIEDKVVFAYKNKEKYSRGSWDTNFGWSEYTGFDTVEAGVIESWYKYSLLESEEFSTYCYLAQEDKEKGTNSAEKFLSDMEATLDMREAEELRKSRKADMNKEGFKGAFSTGLYNRLSIPASVLGGVQALPSAAYSLIKGEDINIYSDSFTLSNFASDVRAITSEKIDSPAWNLVYNAVMSTADSLLAAWVFRDAAPYVLAASAATSRMKELVSQGASDFEIVVGSLASGLIEVVTEKISIDRLFDGDIKPTKFKEWLVNGVIQSCVEGSEEIASEVLNNLSDEILRGQMSDYNQKIRKYQAEGLSKSEATKKASNEILVNIMEAALSGMISGGIGGAVAGGSQMHKFNVIGSNIIKGDNIDSVLNAAEYLGKLDPEIAGQVKALNNFKEKATKGKSNAAYNRTLGKVAVTVAENAIDVKQNIVESAVSKELKIRKAGADVVNKVSKIVSKYIAGEKLSSSEQGYLKHNNVAATVMQEIKAAQEQIKAESVTSIDAQNSSTVPSAPQWAVDMVKALNVVDSAVGIVKYAATGKTKEDEHQAEVNRMIKLLSIASGKTTAEQEAEAGDIPYSQYIKEKESAAQKENTAKNSGDTSHMEDVDGENVIKMDMPDSERAEILENTTIEVVEYGSNDIQSTEEAALYGVSDIEKAVADYVESNIADIEQDIEVLDVKNINAGTRNGFVRKLSNGTYESGTYGTGSGGIVPNENIVRTDSLEEAISEQYKYMLENSSGNVRYIIQKHANNYNNNHNDTKKSQLSDETVEELKNTYKSKAQGILKALCEKFGIFKDYSNDNISLEFNYSRGSLNESVHKQNERGGDYSNFAKMLSLFDDIILNAQPIECHSDKYVETNREDKNLKRVYVLLSAFKDGNSIIPIELSIKEFKSNDKNKLYISVTMKKIEADLMETPPNAERSTKISKSTSIYSLPQIIKNINPSDGDFLKYVPDELLNEEQLQSKNEALEREEVRLENMKNDYLRTTVSEKTVTKRKKSVEKLTKLFGLGLEWSESVKRGKYNPNSRTVMLNPNLTLREMYLEVLKHEFTHDLENRKLYKKFKNFLFESSKSFIEFCEQRVKELTGQTIKGKDAVYALRGEVYMAYKKSKELTEEERTAFNRESAEREMVCDFVAKKLLAEENEETAVKALAELAENQPTIWERFTQWLRDILFEIKHSHNKTDSAQEIKYLESLLKRVYDSKVTDTGETVIKHDIKTDIDGNVFVDIPMNNINVTDGNSIAKNIAIFISKKFKNLIDVYGQKIQINKTTNDEFRNSNYSRYILGKNTQEYFDKLSTINNADEILKVAKNWIGRELEHQRKDDIVEFAEAYVRYRVSNRGYIAKVLVATRLNGAAVLYDITDIRNIKITESPFTMADKNPQRRKNDSVISRISQNIDEVNNNSYNIESHSIEIPYFNDFEKVNSKHYIDMKSAEKTQLTEFPDLMAVLTDRRKRGEISEEDYMLEVRDLLDRASEKYGVIEQGENLEAVNRAYAESVDDTVIDFVEDARQETNKRRLEWMHHKFNNDIPITIQKKIANLVGFDISEFSILLNGEAIHHIDKRHGRKGKHDNSMQNDNDIARMQYIISNADNAEYTVDVSGKQVYDSQYRNSDNTKSYLVTLSKKINGYYYVILAVPDSNSKTMHIKSAYISKKIKKEDSQEFDAKAPNTTSKTNLDISSKYSIPKDTPNVNNQYFIDIEAREAAQLTEFPDLMAVLTDRRKRGEISEEDYMLEVRDLLDRASEKYGVIEQGELAENKMQLPKRVTSDKSEKTKRWVRTVHESGILPEDMEVELEAEILKEAMSYKVINNAEAQRQANTAIQRGTALKEWEAAVNSDGLVGKREIAIGETLLKLAAERKDSKTVMKLIAEVSEMGTRAGQVVQAMSMLKRMDGIGQLYYVQKCVEKINRGLDKRFARKVKKGKISGIPQVKINETLANQLANSKTKEDFEVTYEAMMQSIAEQVPTTFLDKWNAWRYFAMLFNPRTHIRNILGNFGFIPAVRTKDMLASAIERMFLDKSEYTKSAIVKKEYREFALNDFAEAESIITGSGKMNPSDEIRDKQAVFDTKWLEKLRKWNFDALEKEDAIFLKKHYSHALGGFLQARNIDITKDIESSVMEEARKYAIMEAQKATYRDASSIVNVLQRTTHTKSQVWNSIVEGVLPFKKTPINIVRRGIEYSPIGLIKTLTKGNYDLVNGDITASQFIDGIAGGLTGTGIVLLGILLSSLGFINVTGGFGDDEEDDINRLLGRQEYAVEIAGHSYTIDWMAPACIPLFIGVEIQNALEEKGNANFIQSIKNVTGSALEPIINLSMLSGMQDILSSAKYSDGAAVVSSVLWNIALSYGSQALPSLTGAVARTIDGKRRTTYIDRNSWLSDMGQMALNKVESKIPFASKLRSEYVDEFGRTGESGNVFTRAIQNFFSPGYYSKIEEDPVIEELRTLYEQTGETVLPTKPKKYINVNGYKKHLTAEEYEEYAIEVGQERYDYLKELFGNSQSRTLSYEEKRKVISDLYSYALAKGKTHYSEYIIPNLYEKAYEAEKNGISPVDYYLSKIATNVENADTDESGTVTKNERLAAIYEMDVSNDIKAALIALYS